MVHSPDFFFQKTLKYFLRVRLFRMALVEQLEDDSWYLVGGICLLFVRPRACCHIALVFAIMHLYNIFLILYCVCPFLFLYFSLT